VPGGAGRHLAGGEQRRCCDSDFAKRSPAAAAPSAVVKETWEGFWAGNRRDCRNQEGFDSKTQIDLKGMENGKPAPLYDQYENHCRIDSHATRDKVTTLRLTCYEFRDDYKSQEEPAARQHRGDRGGSAEDFDERQVFHQMQEVAALPACGFPALAIRQKFAQIPTKADVSDRSQASQKPPGRKRG
jgi:hypothetical protein